MTMYDPLEALTVDEVCALFKCKRSWVYDRVESDESFPVRRLGRMLRFRRGELEEWFNRQGR